MFQQEKKHKKNFGGRTMAQETNETKQSEDLESTRKVEQTNSKTNDKSIQEQEFLKEIESLKKQLNTVKQERDQANNTLRTMTTEQEEKKLKFDEVFGGR